MSLRESCFDLTDRGLNEILRIFKSKLRYLMVADRISITGMGLEEGVKSLPMLEKLELESCFDLTDRGLNEILRIFKSKLIYLMVADRTSITRMGLEEGVKSLLMLEKLELESCFDLTYKGLTEILRIFKSKLIYLMVADRTSITGMGLEEGVKSLPMLENWN